MSDIQIIGIAGTNGSGKDTVGALLSKDNNFLFVSVTEMLRNGLHVLNKDITRENLRQLSASWRKENGLGVLVDKALEQNKKISGTYSGVAIASIRNPGEVDRIHELGGIVIWVDADPNVRYERIQKNALERGRGGEDNVTFEQFLDNEKAEMSAKDSTDSTLLDMGKVRDACDFTLLNNSDELQLKDQLKNLISEISTI